MFSSLSPHRAQKQRYPAATYILNARILAPTIISHPPLKGTRAPRRNRLSLEAGKISEESF